MHETYEPVGGAQWDTGVEEAVVFGYAFYFLEENLLNRKNVVISLF